MPQSHRQRQFAAVMLAWKGDRSEVKAAADLNVAPNTLGGWIDGTSLPPSTRLPTLAQALGMPLADLTALVARARSARLRRRRAARRGPGAAGAVVAHAVTMPPAGAAAAPSADPVVDAGTVGVA